MHNKKPVSISISITNKTSVFLLNARETKIEDNQFFARKSVAYQN